jgi:hypothetical protein
MRHELSSPSQTLGSWARIPLEAWVYCLRLFVSVLPCVGSGFAVGRSPIQGVLSTVCTIKKTVKRRQGSSCTAEPTDYYYYRSQWSRGRGVFARLNTGIVVSNPTQGMDACIFSVFVLDSGLAMG